MKFTKTLLALATAAALVTSAQAAKPLPVKYSQVQELHFGAISHQKRWDSGYGGFFQYNYLFGTKLNQTLDLEFGFSTNAAVLRQTYTIFDRYDHTEFSAYLGGLGRLTINASAFFKPYIEIGSGVSYSSYYYYDWSDYNAALGLKFGSQRISIGYKEALGITASYGFTF